MVQTPGRGVQAYDLETGERIGGRTVRHEATAVRPLVDGTVWVGGSDGVIHCWPTEHAANATRTEAHDDRVLALGAIRGPGGVPAVVSVGQDHMIRCWSADGTPTSSGTAPFHTPTRGNCPCTERRRPGVRRPAAILW